VEHVDATARQERGVHLEGRILGGGADEHDRSLLDVGQEGVLLCPVEAMDLVDEDDGAPAMPRAVGLRRADDLPDLLDAGEHGREGDEAGARDARHEGRQRGLAGARRSPEDHRVELARLEGRPQHSPRSQQVLLADHLVERARSHAIGERRRRRRGRPVLRGRQRWLGGRSEEVHHPLL
jgi:hypothetical protein